MYNLLVLDINYCKFMKPRMRILMHRQPLMKNTQNKMGES